MWFVCLFVCSDNNFWTKWTLTQVFGILLHITLSRSIVQLKGQSHSSQSQHEKCFYSALDAYVKWWFLVICWVLCAKMDDATPGEGFLIFFTLSLFFTLSGRCHCICFYDVCKYVSGQYWDSICSTFNEDFSIFSLICVHRLPSKAAKLCCDEIVQFLTGTVD